MVAGDVVNTAARLQAVAPVGGIVVGEATWRATRALFDYQPLRVVLVKGKAAPLRIWRVQEARSRLGANARAAPTPFVGRDAELALLQGVYRRMVAEASAQLVTIVGEPGVGKSRLVQEFRAFLGGQPDRSDDPVQAGKKLAAAVAGVVPEQVDRVWIEHRFAPLVGLTSADTGTAEREEAVAAWYRFLQAAR